MVKYSIHGPLNRYTKHLNGIQEHKPLRTHTVILDVLAG